jgi:hypothetical protein
MTPPATPASELRNLAQHMQLIAQLFTVQGEVRLPIHMIARWVAQLEAIAAHLEHR